ncbi:hypothetical protein [Pseudonocardia xinjiangensis]|uniref:Secreted protein n=1 Tax=Pseudonocardia xinjiangensis TaxID=75289 RepID=A0ABX1RF47_9PSEU|nr:hypothetical protein [Pseudonocardia xinjiangensis]NMH77843.1 hypothetical protein [Pseudonocardia xinjiangensis]
MTGTVAAAAVGAARNAAPTHSTTTATATPTTHRINRTNICTGDGRRRTAASARTTGPMASPS